MAKKKLTREQLNLKIRLLEAELAQVRRDNAAWEALAKVLDGSLRTVRDKLQRVHAACPSYSIPLKALINEVGLDLGTAISTLACSRPDNRKLLFSILGPVGKFCKQSIGAWAERQAQLIKEHMARQTPQL